MLNRLAASLLVVAGLATPATADITVFAAASLKTALDEIAGAWTAEGGEPVVISYAGSSQLAKQIEAGAPADIFISASLEWMDYLAERNAIVTASRRNLIGNALVLVGHDAMADAPPLDAQFPLADLLGDGKLAMAYVDSVPAGVYGKQALTSLGLWNGVEAHVVQSENVRGALALVATGEAPLGIVYATDAAAEPKVSVVGAFPTDSYEPIIYPAALVNGAGDGAAAFLDALGADPARAVFRAQGFSVPE